MDKARLLADVKASEGCKLVAYRDSLGYWTIGYGHRCSGPMTWTQEQADAALDADLDIAHVDAQRLTEWPYLDTDARQNAVTEIVFNMGASHWRLFAKCRHDICHKDWQGAHDQLLASLWASQVHATRADRLANYLLTGEFGESHGT